MFLKKLLPYPLTACFALSLLSISVGAQTNETGAQQVTQLSETTEADETTCLDYEPVIVSLVPADAPEEMKPARAPVGKAAAKPHFEHLIFAAIDERLGAHYSWGATGPFTFDCSGFVWSTFHSAGIDFERGSARTLWARFTPATREEQFKFGTLVFFSGLAHVGIVADEHGFYHASRHHGVIYSPFNDYWLSRIDGFRRVLLAPTLTTD
jgi:cell wall-associated NlpC family hydrolase